MVEYCLGSADKARLFQFSGGYPTIYFFKVPTLRNVAMTPPYFHDGSVGTLPEAVRVMTKVQLGKALTDQDTSDIVVFLRSLTGKLSDEFVNTPVLTVAGLEEAKSGATKPQQT
jgi:cytochrome c peroxidase